MRLLQRASIRSFASAVALFFAFFLLSRESPNAALISDTLREHQVVRDNLFNTLSAAATNYTFKYVVIVLPAGTIRAKIFQFPCLTFDTKAQCFLHLMNSHFNRMPSQS